MGDRCTDRAKGLTQCRHFVTCAERVPSSWLPPASPTATRSPSGGAGALCTGRFGLPSPAEAFGFVGGASVAYFGLAVVLRRTTERTRRGEGLPVLWKNGAALPALAATYGLSQVMPGAGASFFLVPLVATVLYLVGVSLLVSRFHLDHEQAEEHPRRRPLGLSPGDASAATELGAVPDGCE
jgi:hypothetical protein